MKLLVILAFLIIFIRPTQGVIFECRSGHPMANAYCSDYCRSLHRGNHVAGSCAKDEVSCLCETSNGKRVKVRIMQDQVPAPYTEKPNQVSSELQSDASDQPRVHRRPQQLPLPERQRLNCDGSPTAEATCNSFCIDVAKGSGGSCHVQDLSCRCRDVPHVKDDPIPAVYIPPQPPKKTVAEHQASIPAATQPTPVAPNATEKVVRPEMPTVVTSRPETVTPTVTVTQQSPWEVSQQQVNATVTSTLEQSTVTAVSETTTAASSTLPPQLPSEPTHQVPPRAPFQPPNMAPGPPQFMPFPPYQVPPKLAPAGVAPSFMALPTSQQQLPSPQFAAGQPNFVPIGPARRPSMPPQIQQPTFYGFKLPFLQMRPQAWTPWQQQVPPPPPQFQQQFARTPPGAPQLLLPAPQPTIPPTRSTSEAVPTAASESTSEGVGDQSTGAPETELPTELPPTESPTGTPSSSTQLAPTAELRSDTDKNATEMETTESTEATEASTDKSKFVPPTIEYTGWRAIISQKSVQFDPDRPEPACSPDSCSRSCELRGLSQCAPLCLTQGCFCSCPRINAHMPNRVIRMKPPTPGSQIKQA